MATQRPYPLGPKQAEAWEQLLATGQASLTIIEIRKIVAQVYNTTPGDHIVRKTITVLCKKAKFLCVTPGGRYSLERDKTYFVSGNVAADRRTPFVADTSLPLYHKMY